MRPLFERIATLRRELYQAAASEAKANLARQLDNAVMAAKEASDAHARLSDALVAETGIPDEMWDALARELRRGDAVDRTPRASVRAGEIAPTDQLEGLAATGLEFLRRTIPPDWLALQPTDEAKLEGTFLTEPLVLVRGMRVASESRSLHRLAQAVSVTEDLLANEPNFDWFAAPLLVSQVAALGRCAPDLPLVGGELVERVSALWRLPSETTDATWYELLVATACVRKGREVEFLAPGQDKRPDLRVHDLAMPLTVECKRRQRVIPADIAEDVWARAMYSAVRLAFISRGITGVLEFDLTAPFEHVRLSDVDVVAARIRLAQDTTKAIAFPWGTVCFRPVPRRISVNRTRLYSPNYLRQVFGWNTDLPEADGIACQVRASKHFLVDEAREPLAMTWTQNDPVSLARRARAPVALLGDAMRQIPVGEAGVIYLCYQEADRASVADERTRLLQHYLHEWSNEYHIHTPIVIVTRLVPRALGHGSLPRRH